MKTTKWEVISFIIIVLIFTAIVYSSRYFTERERQYSNEYTRLQTQLNIMREENKKLEYQIDALWSVTMDIDSRVDKYGE